VLFDFQGFERGQPRALDPPLRGVRRRLVCEGIIDYRAAAHVHTQALYGPTDRVANSVAALLNAEE